MLNAQQKVTGSSTIDFNVKFATDLLADPKQTFYAKLENVMGQPKLIIASADIASDPELLAAGDFKRSALRNRVSDKGQTTAPPGIPLTAKSLRAGNWIANGRYTIGNETADRDGNRVFDISYHSTAHTKSDKLHLNQPAFTLGTAREVDEAGSKQDNKQVDIKASMLLKRARAAHPLAQSDAEALAMYFLDKEESDVDRLDQVNDREDRMIDRLDQVEQDLQRQIDKLQGHEKLGMAEGSWGGSGPGGLLDHYAVYTKQNGQVKRIKSTNKFDRPMNPREAEAYVAAMRKRDPARWTHDTVWHAPADHDLDEGDQIRLGDVQPGTAGYDAWRKSTHKTTPPGEQAQPAGKGDYDWTEKQKIMPKVVDEEKTRLDPKCWTGKKIGTPKTKMKGGVRVNNCVPAEESYTGVMESQGITDPKFLEVARRIDAFAKTIK